MWNTDWNYTLIFVLRYCTDEIKMEFGLFLTLPAVKKKEHVSVDCNVPEVFL